MMGDNVVIQYFFCRNSLHITKDLWKFGLKEYYRGMVSILLRNGPSNVLFFGFRTKVKDYLPDTGQSWWGNFVTDFVSGAFLGAFISTVMYPINVIKAHQQCQVSAEQCRAVKKCKNVDYERNK